MPAFAYEPGIKPGTLPLSVLPGRMRPLQPPAASFRPASASDAQPASNSQALSTANPKPQFTNPREAPQTPLKSGTSPAPLSTAPHQGLSQAPSLPWPLPLPFLPPDSGPRGHLSRMLPRFLPPEPKAAKLSPAPVEEVLPSSPSGQPSLESLLTGGSTWQEAGLYLAKQYGPPLLRRFGPPVARRLGPPLAKRLGPPLAQHVGIPLLKRVGLPLARKAGIFVLKKIIP
ncbi:Hypothetical protein DEACI_2097 [Acididesulfobacillus acetoxydans]|uniref:Uncharacterized protein n=1 Tax=Acididesulfobacillus acetoxydans TaxID=1561005 RepID=A0A8S0X586_9FIRM|nr:Hypothetical protein DEACI_2097 [Acididesulfobacillus acetoxydans]CEJ08861.1 Hypothetical protein DEACI_3342 [Acididesulfobacillus acetoxydans]